MSELETERERAKRLMRECEDPPLYLMCWCGAEGFSDETLEHRLGCVLTDKP